MDQDPNGTQIIAAMTGGREWWQLRPCDLEPWIRTRPPSAGTGVNPGVTAE